MFVSIRGVLDLESEMAPRNNGRSIRKHSVGLDGKDADCKKMIELILPLKLLQHDPSISLTTQGRHQTSTNPENHYRSQAQNKKQILLHSH